MKTRLLPVTVLACALMALATLPGCTTVQPSGWLQDYHRLNHVGGVPIEQVWIQPEFDIRDFRVLYIAPVQIDPVSYRRHGEQDHQAAQRLAAAFRATLEKNLRESAVMPVITTDPYWSNARQQALTLETRITEFNSGNPGARALIGMGAGATEVQIEGRIIENKTGRRLCEFADRRLHPGGTLMLGSKGAKDSEFLIGIDMKQIMNGIVKLFVFMREEGSPNRQR